MVVVVDEGVELGLQLGDGGRAGLGGEPCFLRVWWKRSTLPQVVGWLGVELIWTTPRRCSSCFEGVASAFAAGRGGW